MCSTWTGTGRSSFGRSTTRRTIPRTSVRPARRRWSSSGGSISTPGGGESRLAPPVALLSLKEASLRFGGIVALDEVSFDVQPHTIFGLIGPNGAGKTTAFNVITRLYKVDAGDVVFDGKSLLHTAPSRVVRLGIARTFQNVELFPTMTVVENVLVGAHTVSRFQREATMGRKALVTLVYVRLAPV